MVYSINTLILIAEFTDDNVLNKTQAFTQKVANKLCNNKYHAKSSNDLTKCNLLHRVICFVQQIATSKTQNTHTHIGNSYISSKWSDSPVRPFSTYCPAAGYAQAPAAKEATYFCSVLCSCRDEAHSDRGRHSSSAFLWQIGNNFSA